MLAAGASPQVPNLGDLTRWREWSIQLLAQAGVLCGGTPCQAFSVAGLRGSLVTSAETHLLPPFR